MRSLLSTATVFAALALCVNGILLFVSLYTGKLPFANTLIFGVLIPVLGPLLLLVPGALLLKRSGVAWLEHWVLALGITAATLWIPALAAPWLAVDFLRLRLQPALAGALITDPSTVETAGYISLAGGAPLWEGARASTRTYRPRTYGGPSKPSYYTTVAVPVNGHTRVWLCAELGPNDTKDQPGSKAQFREDTDSLIGSGPISGENVARSELATQCRETAGLPSNDSAIFLKPGPALSEVRSRATLRAGIYFICINLLWVLLPAGVTFMRSRA